MAMMRLCPNCKTIQRAGDACPLCKCPVELNVCFKETNDNGTGSRIRQLPASRVQAMERARRSMVVHSKGESS